MGISKFCWGELGFRSLFTRSLSASFEGVAGASASAGSKAPTYTNFGIKIPTIIL